MDHRVLPSHAFVVAHETTHKLLELFGDEPLFTIDPILDGGETMHLVKTAPGTGPGTFSISFLAHGGHLWDAAFDVARTFGYLYKYVDALEAVGTLTGDTDIPTPESSTMLLATFAMPCVADGRRR